MKTHRYTLGLEWTGNRGRGTRDIAAYDRAHRITAPGKPDVAGSSDPSFRGDPTRWNPEELLVASLAACHKFWYLGLCAGAGVDVQSYVDEPVGVMQEEAGGAGQFVSATLRPVVTIAPQSDPAVAAALHDQAHAMCFIARSVNFPVHHQATIVQAKNT